MKVTIENLGALKQAEFTLGDMTIICGGNNTGKTYATYALFGFLTYWREKLLIEIPPGKIDQLLADGVVHIDVGDYRSQAAKILAAGCTEYVRQLPMVFAAPKERFAQSRFVVTLGAEKAPPDERFERRYRSSSAELFSLDKAAQSNDLVISLLAEKDKVKIPGEIIARTISSALKDILFGHVFPRPFIASAERTGAAIFRKELNFKRNRLLEEMAQAGNNADPRELLFKDYQDYALPVEVNVAFTRQLETLARKQSFIAERHPQVLAEFADIIGGKYTVTVNDELYYIPKGRRTVRLTMDESSSAVRSLLDIGFYLKHLAQPGDLLMVDEPELNLHPENQRRVARLFARLINLGVKVFITTHSDYIIKELNTLIMLKGDRPHLQRVAREEGYAPQELMDAARIKVYIAEEALVMQQGGRRRTRCQTFTPADIDAERGIEARSFDTTIDAMNRIQEAIVWGGE